MRLISGTRLGPYEILAPLGAGAMGEVYRARDTKLQRDVALKILPESFAADPERLARFTREARTLATLNHPNIAQIYGLEDGPAALDGAQAGRAGPHNRALVMELVEGEDLADRLTRGAIPLVEVLPIAAQIAEALEAAHECGAIHRDLKPANIKVRADGTVKVLDFGLAKALKQGAGTGDQGSANFADSATGVSPATLTSAGMLLGTAAYMSPEQARGQTVDARSDLWAFGCVLFEMLTGARAFPAESLTDTIAAVVKEEPRWATLPDTTPPAIQKLLRRCLAKDRKRRLSSAADARLEIEEAIDSNSSASTQGNSLLQSRSKPGFWRGLGIGLVAAAVAVVVALAAGRVAVPTAPAAVARVRRSVEPMPAGASLPTTHFLPALAPGGRRIAFVATAASSQRIYVRDFDQIGARSLDGTDGARDPFFSPDGEWIAFAHHTARELKKVNVRGGGVVTLAKALHVHGGFWSTDGFIYYAPNNGARENTAIWRIAANGGTPERVTTLDTTGAENSHEYPFVIDRWKLLLYTSTSGNSQNTGATIVVQSLTTGQRRTLARGGYTPRYLDTGHLVFARNGSLWAAGFDAASMKLTSDPTPVLNGVASHGNTGLAMFGITQNGDLIYATGVDEILATHLVIVDRMGTERLLDQRARGYSGPSLAPDGRRYAVGVDNRIEIAAFDATAPAAVTGENTGSPIWTRDGQSMLFSTTEAGERRSSIALMPNSGEGRRVLTTQTEWLAANDVAPDGSVALYSAQERTGYRLWQMRLSGDSPPEPLLAGPSHGFTVRFSPDGRWIAYDSDESGREEVYVRPYPGLDGRQVRISSGGGSLPRWTREGRELVFRNGGSVMAANIELSPTFKAQPPRKLFEGDYLGAGFIGWDASADGERFLLIKPSTPVPASLIVVEHWAEEVKQLVPGGPK